MPRIERGLGDNSVYPVISRGNARQEVFHKDKDYEAWQIKICRNLVTWLAIGVKSLFLTLAPIQGLSIRKSELRSALEKDPKLRELFTNLETRVSQK
jgi:hypothetical protein